MKNSKIKVFYTDKQISFDLKKSISKSPLKPYFLMKVYNALGWDKMYFDIEENFNPFTNEDFKIAHTEKYVEGFFTGTPGICETNGLPWNKEFAESVRYTNASLYNALRHSILNPGQVSYSLTAGFHHAQPNNGLGFCTFSGQVIAAVKLYREFGKSGAVLDLDGHFGNSIEDSRHYVSELNHAIPIGFNFAQLNGTDHIYVAYLKHALNQIEEAVIANKIHYVLWCHGADSHEDDDYGGQVNTKYWVECSEVFYAWVKGMDEKLKELGRNPLPIALSLFGGYRKDSYSSVLSLHIKDISVCLTNLCNNHIAYTAEVKSPLETRCVDEKWENNLPVSVIEMINYK